MTFETFDKSDEDRTNKKTKTIDNDKDKYTFKGRPQRLVTFETLITFLTIENNNLNIQSYP